MERVPLNAFFLGTELNGEYTCFVYTYATITVEIHIFEFVKAYDFQVKNV